MKIALITPYAEYPGGVESVNKIIMNILTQEGHQVDLVTTDSYDTDCYNKIMLKLIGLPCITAKRFKGVQEHYDLVIANGEFGWGINHDRAINVFHGCYKGFRNSLLRIISIRTYLILTRDILVQRYSAKGKYVVAVSEYIKDILEKDGITVEQVLSNCVDTELFSPTNCAKEEKYLFVGSYNYYAKGFDILEELADNGLTIDCVTNQRPSLLLGWIQNMKNSDLPRLYNKYKILLFPSRFEGMPMVPLEAMACGLPIITSNVGLGPELMKRIPEFVVTSNNSAEYMDKIKIIESDYATYSLRAREYVMAYHSYESYRQKLLEVVAKVANA